MNHAIRIIFTDLDGTLLNSKRELSPANLSCLKSLEELGIIRVIATGRSLFSCARVFPGNVPADFLIFSTGAGIIELQSGKLLHSSNLNREEILTIAAYLQQQRVDFMVHHRVPENHHFFYHGDERKNKDFARRIELYKRYAKKFTSLERLPATGAQIIAILPENPQRFEEIRQGLPAVQVTRTTSPLDGRSIWMEISPPEASKGAGAAWLCGHLRIDRSLTAGIGNDYNDISLLQYTAHSYLVANAPQDLHNSYTLTRSNNDDGFYHAACDILKSAQDISQPLSA